jgi:hypothetical protein
MSTTVYIDLEGNIKGLSDGFFDKLEDMGHKQVERVSDIEFDHALQLWEARTSAGLLIGRHKERAALIEIERKYLNSQIEAEASAKQTKYETA